MRFKSRRNLLKGQKKLICCKNPKNSKILPRFYFFGLRNKLVDHLEENNLLPDSQHGFRKRRGCLTQLLNHMDNIFNELNSGNEVDVVYFVTHCLYIAHAAEIYSHAPKMSLSRAKLSRGAISTVFNLQKHLFSGVRK